MRALRKFRKNTSNNSNFEEKGRVFMRYTVEFREAFRKEFYRNNMAYPQNYPRTQVALMPIGSKVPEKFQGIPLDEVLIPTNSYSSFYPGQDKFHL